MRSAIFSKILLRSVLEELFQAALAAWAASSANSMSSAVERATLVKALPVMGQMSSKYWPFTGGTHLPPMKLSYWALN